MLATECVLLEDSALLFHLMPVAQDRPVNTANPPVATNFVDSLLSVDGLPAFNGRLFVVHDSPLLWSWSCLPVTAGGLFLLAWGG